MKFLPFYSKNNALNDVQLDFVKWTSNMRGERAFPKSDSKLSSSTLIKSFSLLDSGGIARGPHLFKFENMWIKTAGFVDLVKQ